MTQAPPLSPAARRLAMLRQELALRGLDGFLVPRADEHQGEYVPPRAMRLAWLTGFTGSAGLAAVLADKAALFVDVRYTLQAAAEVEAELYQLRHLVEEPPADWLRHALPAGARLGYDPWLHTPKGVDQLGEACRQAGAELVACDSNPLDAVWLDQPEPPLAPVVRQEPEHAGRGSAEKRAALAATLAEQGVDAVFLSAPESINWLLNIRGGDVDFTPFALGFALLGRDGQVELFMDPRKFSPLIRSHLAADFRLQPPDTLGEALEALKGRAVQLDPATAPAWVEQRLRAAGADVRAGADPCLLPKACKNPVELDGARQAHLRDGVALTRFLAWLHHAAPQGGLSELEVADRLEDFRSQNALYQGPSFPTIAGAGPNGAIVHYRASPASNRRLEPGQLFLLDSGGQYLDGTTDVTRTLAIGAAGAEERHRFTLVLKGHIALARARFPAGTTGSQLDVLARRALWAEGLDYDHGTGHGVGSYLSVHEGPQRISKSPSPQALLPGMVLSNEPGYYKAGAYGIRIENLLAVIALPPVGERDLLGFETLTLAPIDRTLVDPALLDREERDWLNGYHARLRATIGPLVDGETSDWLDWAAAAL